MLAGMEIYKGGNEHADEQGMVKLRKIEKPMMAH